MTFCGFLLWNKIFFIMFLHEWIDNVFKWVRRMEEILNVLIFFLPQVCCATVWLYFYGCSQFHCLSKVSKVLLQTRSCSEGPFISLLPSCSFPQATRDAELVFGILSFLSPLQKIRSRCIFATTYLGVFILQLGTQKEKTNWMTSVYIYSLMLFMAYS